MGSEMCIRDRSNTYKNCTFAKFAQSLRIIPMGLLYQINVATVILFSFSKEILLTVLVVVIIICKTYFTLSHKQDIYEDRSVSGYTYHGFKLKENLTMHLLMFYL